MAAVRDLYEILGVRRTADQDEIQRAYRRLARRYHPDVNQDHDAEKRFKEVSEAYQVLSDPELRRRYDEFGEVSPGDGAPGRAGRAGRAGPGGRHHRAGGPGRGGARRASGGAGGFGGLGGIDARLDAMDLEDLFGLLFRGRGGRARKERGPKPGAEPETEIELSVEEAYLGAHRTIVISGTAGRRTVEVDIPPGATDGRRIRLARHGDPGEAGGSPGDLYLTVRLRPHHRYRVEGRHVHVRVPLAPWEAALGTTVTVDTPGGAATVRVPQGSSSGRRLRLRGRGLPDPHGTPGDLFAEVRIVVPDRPTPDERRLFEELAAVSAFDARRARRS